MALEGTLYGTTWPPHQQAQPPAEDARTYALEAFREYLAGIYFRRRGGQNFRIPKEQIHIEQPDSFENLRFPAIAILPGNVEFNWLASNDGLIESTKDKYGDGTVLLWRGEHIEDLTLEIWEDTIAGRRAIRAAIAEALAPIEETSALRLRLDSYFGLVADFTQVSDQLIDDIDTAKGRRRALQVVRLAVPEVQLINYVTMQPVISVETV